MEEAHQTEEISTPSLPFHIEFMHPNTLPLPLAQVQAKVKATVMIQEYIVWRHPYTKLSQVRFQEYTGSLNLLVKQAQWTTVLIDFFAKLPSPRMTTASIHFRGQDLVSLERIRQRYFGILSKTLSNLCSVLGQHMPVFPHLHKFKNTWLGDLLKNWMDLWLFLDGRIFISGRIYKAFPLGCNMKVVAIIDPPINFEIEIIEQFLILRDDVIQPTFLRVDFMIDPAVSACLCHLVLFIVI